MVWSSVLGHGICQRAGVHVHRMLTVCGSPEIRPLRHWTLAPRDVKGSSDRAGVSLNCHKSGVLTLSRHQRESLLRRLGGLSPVIREPGTHICGSRAEETMESKRTGKGLCNQMLFSRLHRCGCSCTARSRLTRDLPEPGRAPCS